MLEKDINKFYELIEKLKIKCREQFQVPQWCDLTLCMIDGRHAYWKNCRKGLYLFFDNQEKRSDGKTHRIVRIGTHAVKRAEGKSTLWRRLKQHKGNDKNDGGNHRGSIFRLLVGEALINRDSNGPASWGMGSNASKETRQQEMKHEVKVSKYIRELPFLIIRIDDSIDRKSLESSLIALISNIGRRAAEPPCPDEPSKDWLGRHSCRPLVRNSGLWNNQGVLGTYDPKLIETLNHYVGGM